MDGARRRMQPIAILGGARTPFAKAFGAFSNLQADRLGEIALAGALKVAAVSTDSIREVIVGNVATPVHAANIARVIGLDAGIPQDRPAHTVSRNCASGMEAVLQAWYVIDEGRADVIATGGVESMSNVPIQYNDSFKDWMIAWGKAKGTAAQLAHMTTFRPSMLKPVFALQVGLTDPTCGLNMGQTAEILATEFNISREAQDQFAMESHHKVKAAWERSFLGGEVVPVTSGAKTLTQDDGFRPNQSMEALAKLRPVFKSSGGTVTAGNSSQLTDGGCALIVTSREAAQRLGVKPWALIHAYAVVGLDPRRMGLGPAFAIHNLLQQTGKSLGDFDLFEINEAFAAQVLGCVEALASDKFCREQLGVQNAVGRIPREKLNVNGGAIALGHPLGASGNRLLLTLTRALKEKNLRHGLAALCIGGGQGMAMWVERVE